MAASQDFSTVNNGRSRGMSIGGKSHSSHRSIGSGNGLTETHEEKAKRLLTTKADPTLAMNEAQPATVALEKSNLSSLRAMQHRDQYGNVITEPDLSNPTRPRFERPLDTIRSFEAAIDGSYNSRHISYAPTDAAPSGYNSRRGSYFGGGPNASTVSFNRGYSDQGPSTYRQSYSRPDSFVESYGGSNAYQQYPPQNPYSQYGSRQRARNENRMSTDYANNSNGQNFYPQQAYQRSNDNVTAGSGSGGSNNTDQMGNSTDPSSVNSSMDRLQQQLQANSKQERQPTETYGISGFGPGPQLDSFAASYGDGYGSAPPAPPPHTHSSRNGYGNVSNGYSNGNYGGYRGRDQQAPLPPVKDNRNSISQQPIGRKGTLRKNSSNSNSNSDKRQSWFKRRFSKAD